MKKTQRSSKKDIKYYQKKAKEYLAGWRRARADFINYKRRQAEVQREFLQFAKADFILQILPVLDHFEEALKHIPLQQQSSSWVEGILYIKKQLEDVLEKNGVEEIKIQEGNKFNPETMEAIKSREKKRKEDAKKEVRVKKVVCRGYRLNGKILRVARVIVE